MTKARDIMTAGVSHLPDHATAFDAAKRLAREQIGAIPICDATGRLCGMVSDRDLVVEVLAWAKDPRETPLSELLQTEVISVSPDDDVDEVIRAMQKHKIRRLPVVSDDVLVGMISQADVVLACSPERAGELAAAISS